MTRLFKCFALLLLLLAAQHGSVVHELSHVAYNGGAGLKVDAAVVDTACMLCPAFAQAGAPAFAHSFQAPALGRATLERTSDLPHALIGASALGPRSRGPPA
jgi:hypothetical protein